MADDVRRETADAEECPVGSARRASDVAMRAITTTTRRARALGGVALVVALLAVSACSDSNDASTAPTDTTVDRGEVFVGVTPVRVLDTRQEGSAKFTEGETRTLSFADQVP